MAIWYNTWKKHQQTKTMTWKESRTNGLACLLRLLFEATHNAKLFLLQFTIKLLIFNFNLRHLILSSTKMKCYALHLLASQVLSIQLSNLESFLLPYLKFILEFQTLTVSARKLEIMPAIDSHLSSDKEPKNREAELTGSPHEALFFVLAYLPVYELLVMSEVCVSLREALKKDVLPWQNICVERPLNSRLSMEGLLKIASRANGRLKSLSLVNCGKITDDGLQRIVDENPLIRKLLVPGCSGLTPVGIIRAVKTLSQHHDNLESIQINGLYGVKKEHLETLCSYLQPYSANQQKQPIFYHQYRSFQTSRNKEGRMIDLEVCPICSQVRMVFSCSRETCKKKIDCRGCNFCISRCAECGGCVDDEIGETVCADVVCLNCWLHLPKCNFCNKPYCNQHLSPCSSTGFVCDVCHMKAVKFFNDVSD